MSQKNAHRIEIAHTSFLTYLSDFKPLPQIKSLRDRMTVFSISRGVMVNYADLRLERGIGTNASEWIKFEGDYWSVGYSLGVLWQPVKQVSIGATFRSLTTMDYHGHTDVNYPIFPNGHGSASASLPLPLEAVAGISYRPTPKWNLEFDADYTDWRALDNLTVYQTVPVSVTVTSLNWQSSWNYEVGATRYFDDGWHVSARYIYSKNSAPDAGFTPLVADADRHFVSVGAGFTGERFDFDLAYQFGISPTRTVSGNSYCACFPARTSRWQL